MSRLTQTLHVKSFEQRFLIWLLAVLVSFCWSYAFVARFTSFFMASKSEKIFYLGISFLIVGTITSVILHRFLPLVIQKICSKQLVLTSLASITLSAFLLLVIIPPLYFPEEHTLVILPVTDIDGKDLTVITIRRIEMPGSHEIIVSPSFLENHDQWESNAGDYPLIWRGGSNAALIYSRFMQAGVEAVLRTGLGQGKVEIAWDGHSSQIDLEAASFGTHTLRLTPALNWSGLNPSWQILVGMGILAQWFGLIIFFALLFQIPLVFSIRAPATIGVSLAVIFFLLPIVNVIDPFVNFNDPQLEEAVRMAVKKTRRIFAPASASNLGCSGCFRA